MLRQAAPEAWERVHALLRRHEDAYLDIAGGRYEWIGRMVRAAVVRPRASAVTLTDRVDKIATHPLWGLALLRGIFCLVFWLTYTVALPIGSKLRRCAERAAGERSTVGWSEMLEGTKMISLFGQC